VPAREAAQRIDHLGVDQAVHLHHDAAVGSLRLLIINSSIRDRRPIGAN
jgi:hypothetical protein